MNQETVKLEREVIIAAIEQILYKGGKSNFVIFNLNSDYFIQIAAGRGDYEIYCEAISDNYLTEEKILTKAQKDALSNLNWNDPKNSEDNYHMKYKVHSELKRKELAALILKTANQVYNCESIDIENIILNLE